LRATILEGGEVRNKNGECVGYINEDGSAGDVHEKLLGEISGDQVIDANNTVIGSVNFGTGELRDCNAHWAKVNSSGEVTDHVDAYKAKIDDFTYHKMKIVASYLFFFDPALLDDASVPTPSYSLVL